MNDPFWRDHAACSGADPRLFDEPSRERAGGLETDAEVAERLDLARFRYCNGCPVRNECITDAKRSGDGGIRAGEMLASAKVRPIVGLTTGTCGTEAGYQRHRRHGQTPCPACRAAASKAFRARRQRNHKALSAPRHDLIGYDNYGCRCAACKEAKRVYSLNRRTAARKGTAA